MEKIKETLNYLNSKIDNFKPEFAIILGSGLGVFCDNLSGTRVSYNDIPNFASSDVVGHKGELLYCNINGKNCLVMQGRFHFYEGNSMKNVTYPIKVFKMAGVKTLFITNAAGALKKELNVGDIVLINDHINGMGTNPLIGKNDDRLGDRFPDMSNVYDKNLREIAKNVAKKLNIELKNGVYFATTGPNYETPAEVRAYRLLGADIVGMSSVPEAIISNYLKMNTIAFSLVTNHATGVSDKKLTHEEVLETGKTAGVKLSTLIKEIISKL